MKKNRMIIGFNKLAKKRIKTEYSIPNVSKLTEKQITEMAINFFKNDDEFKLSQIPLTSEVKAFILEDQGKKKHLFLKVKKGKQ